MVHGEKRIGVGIALLGREFVRANAWNGFDLIRPFGGYEESGFGRKGSLQGLALIVGWSDTHGIAACMLMRYQIEFGESALEQL